MCHVNNTKNTDKKIIVVIITAFLITASFAFCLKCPVMSRTAMFVCKPGRVARSVARLTEGVRCTGFDSPGPVIYFPDN